jgi:predicted  nucleic acid-binding Zn-ribbon protein
MSVTTDLLKLFQVDKQLRGLRSRLDGAERFLEQQKSLLKEIDDKKNALEAQVRQFRATGSNDEGEASRLEAKITALREQLNSVKTAKEYNAGLTELNNYKEAKGKLETTALEAMAKVEQLAAQVTDLKTQRDERGKMVAGADADRKTKEAEIKDRVQELTAQRATLAAGIAPESLKLFEHLVKVRGDDAMAPVEVLDRRNHEFACTGCMMTLPVETVSAMLSGRLTRCVSCSCIIFTEEELLAVKPPPKAPGKSKGKGKQVAKA